MHFVGSKTQILLFFFLFEKSYAHQAINRPIEREVAVIQAFCRSNKSLMCKHKNVLRQMFAFPESNHKERTNKKRKMNTQSAFRPFHISIEKLFVIYFALIL